MTESEPTTPPAVVSRTDFPALIDVLRGEGWTVIGPQVADGALVYAEITHVEQLPAGWGDEQAGGKYRLTRRDDGALFGATVAPQSWKRFLSPPRTRLWHGRREGDGFTIEPESESPPRHAFLGVRACELAAIRIQDRMFDNGTFTDEAYASRRGASFIIAVACGQAGHNCFCASMGSGPGLGSGFDLSLFELLDNGRHDFLITAGSGQGARILAQLPQRAPSEADFAAAEAVTARALAMMGNGMAPDAARILKDNPRHRRWEMVARRCLTCGNCTMVCPTCFCTTVLDSTDLGGSVAERWRQWDSCFSLDFSYIHGGPVRPGAPSRYRQWITHKLSTWHEQFGVSGCVGCGRCITWCPVGIDIREEVAAMA